MIEDSILRVDRLIDLGPNYLNAKKHIVTRVVPMYRRTYGNPFSVRGLLWRAKRLWDVRREPTEAAQGDGYLNNSQSPTPVAIKETIHAAV